MISHRGDAKQFIIVVGLEFAGSRWFYEVGIQILGGNSK
jgi:hypothetical protein